MPRTSSFLFPSRTGLFPFPPSPIEWKEKESFFSFFRQYSEDFDPESEKQHELVGGLPTPTAAQSKDNGEAPEAPASSSSSSAGQKRKIDEVIDDDELVIIEDPAADSKGKKKQRV